MMAANGNDNIRRIIRGIYTGDELPERRVIQTRWGEEIMEFILPEVTHLTVAPNITFIPRRQFYLHQNIVELICHENVVRIERVAFHNCTHFFKRLIMNGVEEVEEYAFYCCKSLEDVECNELERIGKDAFGSCLSLRDINLPSARIVEAYAFGNCEAMEKVTFGKKLESIREHAFNRCPSLKQITIPLKNGLLPHDDTFQGCESLRQINLVEEEVLHETVNAFLLEDWSHDVFEVIYSIEDELLDAPAGDDDIGDDGEKTTVIREWISSVLSKIIYYKAQHRQILNEAASILEHLLPKDIVLNNVLSFIELPSYTFDGEEEYDEQNDATEKITTP